jgi:selenide, water dikinase
VAEEAVRLTQLTHGGGGGCKVAPDILERILAGIKPGIIPPQLLVGKEKSDDAAVYQLNAQQAIVATTDFFTPIVDDPHDFGRIAATAAISNIYAMGATPLFALALVGMPLNALPLETIGKVLEGGEAVCRLASIPIAGGHTIDALEPIYGLVVIGLANPAHLMRNAGACPGDRLILGKQLGVGIYSNALKRGELGSADYQALIASTTQLNTPGPVLACLDGVHAVTDVTGFGLLGHLHGMCKASKVKARIDFAALPRLTKAMELIDAGFRTGASHRNWGSFGKDVKLAASVGEHERMLLTDPQTSGGLLVSCTPDTVTEVLSIFLQQGFPHVSVIGDVLKGKPSIEVI